MTEALGGALMALGGTAMSAAVLFGTGTRSAIERARELLGNSDAAVVQQLPPDIDELLDRLS